MKHIDEFNRAAEMLKSVMPELDPATTGGKAAVMRALLGYVPVTDDTKMLAVCECGWRGTMLDTRMQEYQSEPENWRKLAGRQGWHYECPECGRVVWATYSVIS